MNIELHTVNITGKWYDIHGICDYNNDFPYYYKRWELYALKQDFGNPTPRTLASQHHIQNCIYYLSPAHSLMAQSSRLLAIMFLTNQYTPICVSGGLFATKVMFVLVI